MSDTGVDYVREDEVEGQEGEAYKPVLDDEEQTLVCAFLKEELRLAKLERIDEETEWKTIRRQRIGRPEFKHKDVPFPNASNVVPPGMVIAQNTMYGITKNAFGAKEPFWAIEPLQHDDDADKRRAKTAERYLQLLADGSTDLVKRTRDREIQEEADLMGTVFVKVDWHTDTQRIPLPSPDGTTTMTEVVFHDGPRWTVVPREEAFYRIREKSVQKARWWAHRIELEESEMEERFATGEWKWEDDNNPESWKTSVRMEALEYERDVDEKTGGVPLQRRVYDVYEVFLRWDITPKDGVYEEVIVWYFEKANVLVRQMLNPLGVRPVREMNFIQRSFRLDGIGVGALTTQMQRELEFIHNQRNDSVKITGLRMFVARKNCGIKARETLKAGKILFVDNIKEDFAPLQAGETYPSSLQSENMTWQYIQKASLMSDTMAGQSDQTLKSRDTASIRMQKMKESSGILGSIIEGMEDAYSDLGLWTFYNLVYNRERVLSNEEKIKRLSAQELQDLRDLLEGIPLDQVPLRLRFSVRTADIEHTYEVRRQNTLTLVSIYNMYQKTILPLIMQLYATNPQTGQPLLPPPAQEVLLRLIVGNSVLMEKIFVFFGEDDSKDLLPTYKKLQMLLEIKDLMEKGNMTNMEAMRDRLESISGSLEGVVQPGQGEAAGFAGPPGGGGLAIPPAGGGGPVERGGENAAGGGIAGGQAPPSAGEEQSIARSFGYRR